MSDPVKIDWDWQHLVVNPKIVLSEEVPCDVCGQDCRYRYYKRVDETLILCPLCFMASRG